MYNNRNLTKRKGNTLSLFIEFIYSHKSFSTTINIFITYNLHLFNFFNLFKICPYLFNCYLL